jgi:hypothetical protein
MTPSTAVSNSSNATFLNAVRNLRSVALTFALMTAGLFALPAAAQDFHDHGHDQGHGDFHRDGHDDWHGHGWHGDIHHFGEYDYWRWHGGRWFHGPHGGRDSWWWIVDGDWYAYSAPIYPYPDPFVPPDVIVATAPPPNSQYVYYCSNPAGYYPYVMSCLRPWRGVVTASLVPPQVAPAPFQPGGPAVVVTQPPAYEPPVYSPPVYSPPLPQPTYTPAPVVAPGGQRQVDDRQLNAFAAELDSIMPHQPHARAHLKALQGQVAAFHQAIFQRDYNAMDILHDTESLEKRIAAKRAAFKANNY